jgi:ABC-type nickel/cobalt efflux system permease component RcnA
MPTPTPTSRKVILLLNILLIVVIYAWLANSKGADGYTILMAFALSLYHTAINLVLAILCMVIVGIQRLMDKDNELFLSLGVTFFISTVLVAVLSFPACLIVPNL